MVQHRQGDARNQIEFSCLDDLIASDNMVRVIDAFVDILDFNELGFAHFKPKKTGTPPYHPALLLRIYLYGYLNRVRSSRKLETECGRNIEMHWLCEKQVPCYHTIATFRTFSTGVPSDKSDADSINHRKALKEVFRAFNRFLNGEGLFGKETVATDGTKMRAQNAKKKNYTEDKLDKKIEISETTIAQYLDEMDEFDKMEQLTVEQQEQKKYVQTKLQEVKKWKDKFTAYKQELKQRQEIDPEITQISLTDPDARSIVLNNSGHSEVAYNVLTAVDEKHKLIAHFFADNVKDTSLLAPSLIATKAEFDNDFNPHLHKIEDKSVENSQDIAENMLHQAESMTDNTEGVSEVDLRTKLNPNTSLNGLADKGFHAATQLHECAQYGIITYVAIPQPAYSGKDKAFTVENFRYNETDDTYTCPNNQILTTNGVWYDKKDRRGQITNRVKRYNRSPKECALCPFAEKCLSKNAIQNRISRQIERAEHQQASEDNKKRMATVAGKELYKKRQAIVEHPFGTIKRQWDSSYTLLKGLEKVSGEFAIVFTCYNLRRAVSILSVKSLLQRLNTLKNRGTDSLYRFFNAFLSLPVSFQPFNCVFSFLPCKEIKTEW
jgi:transposase